jgi:hypothetical protein
MGCPRFDKLEDHAEQEKIKITEPMISWFFIIASLKNVVSAMPNAEIRRGPKSLPRQRHRASPHRLD